MLPSEVLASEVLAGEILENGVVKVALEPEDNTGATAAVRILKPFTCIPYTTVGPVETAVGAGTVEVTIPQGPFGVVDSYVSV